MARVPREAFVPQEYRHLTEEDGPLPIGFDQTISQPFIVAWMTEELEIQPDHRVLEVGTGCGYQTAVLAELAKEVYSLEIIAELSTRAAATLGSQGYTNVHLRIGSGYDGWPEFAPFDRIILTAAPPDVPQPLIDQLADGGRLVAPIGIEHQIIVTLDKRGGTITRTPSVPVRFVPMR